METKKCKKCGQVKPVSEFYKWVGKCKTCYKTKNDKYYAANKEKLQAYTAKYQRDNKDKVSKWNAKWRKENPNYQQEWREENRELINEQQRDRMKDPVENLKNRCRTRVRRVLKAEKDCSTPEYIGCSWAELKAHIEDQFLEGMTWDNMSEWHVDHIIPLFEGKTLDTLLPLLHYTNLQPLWAYDNRSKGTKLDNEKKETK